MRHIVLFLVTFFVFLSGYACYMFRQSNEAPDVHVIGDSQYNAGVTYVKQPVVHTFIIVNSHSFAVGLSAPVVGCSCTTATAPTSVIPPHGSAAVTMHIIPEDSSIAGSVIVNTTHGSKKSELWLLINGKVATASERAVNAKRS